MNEQVPSCCFSCLIGFPLSSIRASVKLLLYVWGFYTVFILCLPWYHIYNMFEDVEGCVCCRWEAGIFFYAWCLHIHVMRAPLVLSQQQSHLCDIRLWEVVAVADGRLLMRTRRRRMESVSVSGALGWEMWLDLPVGAWRWRRCQGQQRWRWGRTSPSASIWLSEASHCAERK